MEGENNNLDNKAGLNQDTNSNKSFVKKVKSHVSGLLSTSFGKWFSGDNNSEAKVRRNMYDDDDDSDESQPPPKRVKMPTPETKPYINSLSNNFIPISSRNDSKVRGNIFEPVAGPSGLQQLQSNKPSATMLFNGDKGSESGESDMSPLPQFKNLRETAVNYSTPTSTQNRSLFNDRSFTPQLNTSLSSRRPSFNASTFGSPNFTDRTLSTKQILNSPFYNGRTIYGGASAYSSCQKNVTERPKSQIKVKPVNNSVGNDVSLSRTARRILNALEEFNPVVDAKKIPYPKNKMRSEGILSKYTGANPYLSRDRKIPFALNKELQVPTVPDLLKMKLKERLQDSTVSVRQIATTSKSVLNRDDYRIRSKGEDLPKHTNKVKNKLTATRQKVDNQQVEEVKLPEISLPITTLPKFDFSLPPPPSSAKQPLITVACNESSKAVSAAPPIRKTETVDVKGAEAQFEFSQPLILADNLKSIIAINNFKFSDPIFKQKEKNLSDIGLNFKTTAPETVMLKMKNSDLPSVAVKLSKENIEEVFNKPTTDSLDKFKSATSLWECNVCLIRNAPDKLKCAACEALKPDSSSVTSNNVTKPALSLSEQFKPPSSTWECPTCLIRNKDEVVKCLACETMKPGMSTAPSQSGFGDVFKKKEGEWECSICMIRNKEDKTICEACETPKPGTKGKDVQVQEKVDNIATFNFGIMPKTASIAASGTVQTPTVSLQSTSTTTTVSSTISAFTFGIPATQTVTTKEKVVDSVLPVTKVQDSNPSTEKPVQESIKPVVSTSAFTFSIPTNSNITTTTAANPIPQQISKPTVLSTSPSAFRFGKSPTTTVSSLKRSANNSDTPATTDNKKLSSSITFQPPAVNSLSIPSTRTIQSSDKPLFNIGKSSISQNSTTSSNFMFTPTPSQAQPAVTTTTTTNLFTFGAKTTSQSLFGNTVTTTQSPVFKFSQAEQSTPNQPTFGIAEKQPTLPLFVSPTSNSMTGTTKPTFEVPPSTQPFGPIASTTFVSEPKPPMTFSTESKTQSLFGGEPKASLFGTEQKVVSSFGTEQPAHVFNADQKAAPVFGTDQKSTPLFSTDQKTATVFGTEQKSVPVFGNEQKAATVFGTEQKTVPVFAVEQKVAPFGTGVEQKPPIFGGEKSQSIFGTDQKPLPAFGSTDTKPFSFGSTDAKPFSFSAPGSSNETPKPSLFSFGAKSPEPSKPFGFGATPAPTQPAGGFNFNSTATPAFNFNAPKVESASPFQTAPSASNMFNPLPAQTQPLQNDGFNFGNSTNANNSNKTGFNFGATNQFAPPAPTSTPPAPRGFWGMGNNANANPVPAAGGFNFGQAASPQAPSFNANMKPNFNFTAGNIMTGFSATAENSPVAQRRRLKAVRRNPR